MKLPLFSILLPTYKSEKIIGATIESILGQTTPDFEVIICDNDSRDKTEQVVSSFHDERLKFFQNEKNLGYPMNLEKCRQKATGKYIYLLGSDDILSPHALERTLQAFQMDRDVGAVTRPYYWFENDSINRAVRVVSPLDAKEDRLISIFDSEHEFHKVFESVGQLSGLAIRRDWVEEPVNPDVFTAHIYPFLSVFKKHKVVFLKDYLIAVRIFSSLTRTTSSIYEPLPTSTWIKMFKKMLSEKKYRLQQKWGVTHICLNFEGLVQIKNYARTPLLYQEISLLVRNQPSNLLNLKFWFFALGCIFLPRFLLVRLVDVYKSRINANNLQSVHLLT